MTSSPRPPSVLEIVLLPAVGLLAVHLLYRPERELLLFFAPFLVVTIRLFVAQFKIPQPSDAVPEAVFRRAAARCIFWNQAALPVLLCVEASGVVAQSPTVPREVWAFAVALFALYVSLRWISRRYWIVAAGLNIEFADQVPR